MNKHSSVDFLRHPRGDTILSAINLFRKDNPGASLSSKSGNWKAFLLMLSLCFLTLPCLAQDTDNILVCGHQPGEYYYAYGRLLKSNDYGRTYSIPNDTMIISPCFRDARESCLYGLIWNHDNDRYWGRTFDGGENWEEIESQDLFWSPHLATGRLAGEIYGSNYQHRSTLYSDDYGESYQEFEQNYDDPHTRFVIGHEDGEIYSSGDQLWRSRDYGRNFDMVFAGDDSTSLFRQYDIMEPGPADGELYFFRPNTQARGFYLSRSEDHGESFTRLCRIYMPEYPFGYFDQFIWDIAPGVEEGEISIAWAMEAVWDMSGRRCFITYYSSDYGKHWQYFETFNNTDWHWDSLAVKNDYYPTTASLVSVYPNPFNAFTNVSFSLVRPQDVQIDVFNIQGRVVLSQILGRMTAGEHRLTFPAQNSTYTALPGGSYLCRLIFDNKPQFFKIVVLN